MLPPKPNWPEPAGLFSVTRMSTTPGEAMRLIWFTVSPRPALIEVGTAEAAGDEMTCVVVTDLVVVLPLATTSAIAPPATAPARIGRNRLTELMVGSPRR